MISLRFTTFIKNLPDSSVVLLINSQIFQAIKQLQNYLEQIENI